ncbi:flavin reductase [Alicyclobacillus contaminans]|uniref:flavin reductase family protein n=1 Tax=Alicyclobacillus contaminans TaxID=392016 RepID=UPI0003FBB182|nr:flavin reductase family protein [Alicyclobacillus contaminans]GMA52276.1 flavin reductase [Alicyclobacillus contaminans]
MPVSADDFRQALGRFASGVTVVTTTDAEKLGGITVSAFCSLSLQPPYVLICIDKRSTLIPMLQRSRVFAVNILSDAQAHLSNQFASKSGDKFSGVAYQLGQLGVPLLEDALAHVECSVRHEWDGGDHLVFVGEVEATSVHPDGQPLLYYRGQYGRFEAQNA